MMLSAQDDRASEAEVTAERLFMEAHRLSLLEEYEKALPKFDQLLDEHPNEAQGYYERSKVHFALENYELSLEDAAQSSRIEPDNYFFLSQYAKAARKLSNDDLVLDIQKRLFVLRPEDRRIAFNLTGLYEKRREYKEALKVLESLEVSTDEADIRLLQRKAQIYGKWKKPKLAEKLLKSAIKDYPENTRLRHLLAKHYVQTRERDKAQEVYMEILKIDPEDSHAAIAVANTNKQSGNDVQYLRSIKNIIESPTVHIDTKMKELIPFLEKTNNTTSPVLTTLGEYAQKIVTLHDDQAKAYAFYGDVLSKMGLMDLAQYQYERSLSIDKSVYAVWEQLMFIQLEKKNYEKLFELSEEVLDYFPNRGRNYFMKGIAMHYMDRNEEASFIVERGLIMSGKDNGLKFECLTLLANIYGKLNNLEKAQISYENAMSLQPNNTHVLNSYSHFLIDTDRNTEKAMAMTQKSLTYNGKDPIANQNLARIYFHKGEYKKSLRVMSEVVESLSVLSARTHDYYGDILFQNGRIDEAVQQWQMAKEKGLDTIKLNEKIRSKSYLK